MKECFDLNRFRIQITNKRNTQIKYLPIEEIFKSENKQRVIKLNEE